MTSAHHGETGAVHPFISRIDLELFREVCERASSGASDGLSGFAEHRMEHRAGQLAGKRILLAWMVRPHQGHSPRQAIGRPVSELGGRGRDLQSFYSAGFQILIECDLPQRDHHAGFLEEM